MRVEGNVGPVGKVTVVSGLGGSGERANVVKGLRVGRINCLDTLLDEVEDDNGLPR